MQTTQSMPATPSTAFPFSNRPPVTGPAGGATALPDWRPARRPGELPLGRLFGVPIGFHWSWLLILALVGWSLAAGYFPFALRRQPPSTYLTLGAVSVALLCASVLAHELAHAIVARRHGIPVRGITFFAFGGAAQILGQPRTPGAEFRIAIVGPLTSLALAAIFAAVAQLDRTAPFLALPSAWLARTNLALALFNLLPGFPLDGGRVLRAALWRFSGNPGRATRLAGATGRLVAFGLMGWGAFSAFQGGLASGAWLFLIGTFLHGAAVSQTAQAELETALDDATVDQALRGDTVRVPGWVPLDELVRRWVLVGGHRHFLVEIAGRAAGALSLAEVRRVPRGRWAVVTAAAAMAPPERQRRVAASTRLLDALRMMEQTGADGVLVVDPTDPASGSEGGRVIELLTKERASAYVRLRAELGDVGPAVVPPPSPSVPPVQTVSPVPPPPSRPPAIWSSAGER
jgi:Zn-dependent protease